MKKEAKDNDVKWKDTMEDLNASLESSKKYLVDEYGRNPQLSVKVLSKQKVEKSELKSIEGYYYYSTDEEVTDAYKLKVRMTIKGKKEEDSNRGDVYVVKFKGDSWKLCLYNSDLDVNTSFLYSLW